MAKKKEEEVPSLLTGTLPNIKETGEPLTDVQNRINVDEASYHPDQLFTFQKVMSGIADRVYKERQNADLNTASQYFNPTQMSGGNYASVLGWLEGNRGRSVSDMYNTTMKTYVTQQEMLQSDLQNLRTMKYNIQNDIRAFKLDLIKNSPGAYESMSSKAKKSIEVGMPNKEVYSLMDDFYKDALDRQKRMEDMEFKMKQEEHNLKMQEGNEAKQKLQFVQDLRTAQQDMIKKRADRQAQGGMQNVQYAEGGIEVKGTGTQSNYGLYNDITDYWDNFWNVMKNNPKADPMEVQKFLVDGLSPTDRASVDLTGDIQQNIEAGLYAAQKIVEGYEKKFGGEDAVMKAHMTGKLDDSSYQQYMEARTRVMIYQ